jgi:D-alanyl-D-alanine carboxypeptidase
VGAVVVFAHLPLSGQGVDDARVRLQAKMDSLVASSAIPGMNLGVVLADGTAFGVAAGMADTLRGPALAPEAVMLQGSVGKTYFGAVALQLVGEGVLELDAPIARHLGDEPWLDRLPNGRTATLRHLMSHTSGIVRYEFNPRFLEDLTAEPMRSFTPEQRLSYLFDTEAAFPVGQGWEYSDTNYILVAMLIEKVTGRPAYDEIRRRLLDPLQLAETYASDRPDVPGLVQGYAGPANPFGGFDEMVEGGALRINPQFEWGGGGMASSARDLALWTRAVQEGRAFPPTLLDEYREGHPAPLGPEGEYGLGVIMVTLPAGRAWGHSGFMPGYRTEAYHFPDLGFTLALQVNTSDPQALPRSPLRMLSELAATLAEVTATGRG